MKKVIIALSLCVASTASMATSVCSGTAGPGTPVTTTLGLASGTAGFVTGTGFTPRCSANTTVDFQQTTSAAAAGAISTKGNQVFSGHTNGGAVTGTACAATACIAGEAATAAGTALTNSSS